MTFKKYRVRLYIDETFEVEATDEDDAIQTAFEEIDPVFYVVGEPEEIIDPNPVHPDQISF